MEQSNKDNIFVSDVSSKKPKVGALSAMKPRSKKNKGHLLMPKEHYNNIIGQNVTKKPPLAPKLDKDYNPSMTEISSKFSKYGKGRGDPRRGNAGSFQYKKIKALYGTRASLKFKEDDDFQSHNFNNSSTRKSRNEAKDE